MCNGGVAEQDWTGINWLRKSFSVEESHGEILATPFLLLEAGRIDIMISSRSIYFPNTWAFCA